MTSSSYEKEPSRSKALRSQLEALRRHRFVSEPVLEFLNADFERGITKISKSEGASRKSWSWQDSLRRIEELSYQDTAPQLRISTSGTELHFELLQLYDLEGYSQWKEGVENLEKPLPFPTDPNALRQVPEEWAKYVRKILNPPKVTFEAAKNLQARLRQTLEILMHKNKGEPLLDVYQVYCAKGYGSDQPTPYYDGAKITPVYQFTPEGIDTVLWFWLIDFVSQPHWKEILRHCPGCKIFHTQQHKTGYVTRKYCSDTCLNTVKQQRHRSKKQPVKKKRR